MLTAQSSMLKRLRLTTRRMLDADLMGNYRSAFRGSGLSFAELREYAPGDDTKRIDWRSSARSNKVYLKSFEEERQLSVMLLIDTSASAATGLSGTFYQHALTFSSLITGLTAVTNDLCGLISFSDTINECYLPSNRRTQSQRILNALLKTSPDRSTNIAGALRHLRQRVPRKSLVFLVSDFCAPAFDQALRAVACHHDLVLVMPKVKTEMFLPAQGIIAFRDSESGECFTIDAHNQRTRRALHNKIESERSSLRAIARQSGAEIMEIDNDPLTALVALMNRRQRRTR